MSSAWSKKKIARVLHFLKQVGPATVSNFDDGTQKRVLLTGIEKPNRKLLIDAENLASLEKSLLIGVTKQAVKLSPKGDNWLKTCSGESGSLANDGFQNQHRCMEKHELRVGGQKQLVLVNGNESPLYRLHTRKTATGQPFINEEAFVAGERLRADFTFGRYAQKVTSNWEAYSTPIDKISGAGGRPEISDNALDARNRVEKALDHLGAELASLLTDVCCHLKGLETVERERRWPPRSAKLMLRTGLDLLARHYGTGTRRSASKMRMTSWGAEGYRPEIAVG